VPEEIDLLQSHSLEWALAHLSKFGDTDLLPVPFEYEAIKADWDSIRTGLHKQNLCQSHPGALIHFLVPKPEGAFRVVTRLDPLDPILYTAAVYECATAIEKSRADKSVACAYRIDLGSDGRFFGQDNGWDMFTTRSAELLCQNDVTYVVTADIADFYSQIGHHRVHNALEDAGVKGTRAQNLEKILGGWSALQSRGLPVGPHASIILAEASLNDVDQHLASRGYRHVRYVDDFRIFCTSHAHAVRATHDLCDYLFTSHRLALQPSKTRTYKKGTFATEVLKNPEYAERKKKTEKVQKIVQAWHEAGYLIADDDIDTSDLDLDVLVELFEECVEQRPLRLGLARYLFRKAASLRTNRIQHKTLHKLQALVPVLRDVLLYLKKSKQAKSATDVSHALLNFGLKSDYAFLPYVQEWIVDTLTGSFAKSLTQGDFLSLAPGARSTIGVRGEALLARARGDISWVRQYKERWRALGEWDRRAVVLSGSVLSNDERTAWKRSILTTDDPLDRAVAIYALG
jgi:hypothetical protein